MPETPRASLDQLYATAAAWPNCDAWASFLYAVEQLTEADLAAEVAALPGDLRSRLVPDDRRYSCGVCNAFGSGFYRSHSFSLDDPRWVVFAYHETPKLRMRCKEDQWYGSLAEEVFHRCRLIYDLAGSAPEEAQ